jgi:hypothetical protein
MMQVFVRHCPVQSTPVQLVIHELEDNLTYLTTNLKGGWEGEKPHLAFE